MKKKPLQLLLVLALVAAVGGALLLLNREPEQEEEQAETVYVLGGSPQPFVQQIHIENNLDAFTVVNGYQNAVEQMNSAEDKVSLEGVDEEYANKTLLKSLLNYAAALESKQEVESGEGVDLAAYGLETPGAVITVTYDNGTDVLHVGDEAPGSQGTYVAKGNTVYLVASSNVNNFLLDRYEFVSKTVTPGNSQTSAFQRLTLSGPAFESAIVVEASGEATLITSGYDLVEPVQAPVDSATGAAALRTVFGIGANQVVEQIAAVDLAVYGLDQPFATAEIIARAPSEWDEEVIESFTVYLSQPDKEGNLFCYTNRSPFLYQTTTATLDFLDVTVFGIMSKMPVTPNINDIAEVEVQTADGTVLFTTQVDEEENLTAWIDGQEMDASLYRTFYRLLISATYDAPAEELSGQSSAESLEGEEDGEAPADPEPEEATGQDNAGEASDDSGEEAASSDSGDLLVQVTLRYRDGSGQEVMHYSVATVRRVLLQVNDGPGYYLQRGYVNNVLEALDRVSRGEDISDLL